MKHLRLIIRIILLIGLGIFPVGCGDNGGTKPLYGWAVGSNVDGYGTIIHTKNGGSTWVRQGSSEMIPDVSLEDVAAVDRKNIWVVGLNREVAQFVWTTESSF